MRIGIIGAGSIGSLFGGYLATLNSESQAIEVILFARKEHVKAIRAAGLSIQKEESTVIVKNIKAFENLEEAERNDISLHFDFVFLTTKAYDSAITLQQYQKLITESNFLILLQNGIGNEEVALNYCDEKKLLRMVTTNGALREDAGRISHTGTGITKIGFPAKKKSDEIINKALDSLKTLLSTAGLETIVAKDIVGECWEKVFINIGINAFGALTRLRNGQLLQNQGLKDFMARAIKEAIMIAKKKSVSLSEKDFVALTYEVAKNTASNKNSMLQDILKGKKTEIDFINGRISKYAKEMNISVPINEFITVLIKGLETSFECQ